MSIKTGGSCFSGKIVCDECGSFYAAWFGTLQVYIERQYGSRITILKPLPYIVTRITGNCREGYSDLNGGLLNLLRSGGFILYVRHGEATIGEDQPNLNYQYCFTQRNLSEIGRRQSIYYGFTLRNLRVPISYPVQTSPFCRTIETAQLAFGSAAFQVDPFLFEIYRLSGNISDTELRMILSNLRSRLEIIPTQGTNRVIIAHSFPEGVGLGTIADMGTVVIRPRGYGNGYEIVARLSLMDLADFITLS